ncbi:N-acyl homoserine lactonase family protein [Dactylosporangium salmoneum]|uniref:Metallo-beta-lactamase domain-containing protein n=1 Tax=Dactylosporangium salmoneum TaxID=53361 RepID=A0ABP5V986_9ACTN
MTDVVELIPLETGRVREVGVPIPVYLLRLTGGRHALVDTGCARAVIGDPESHFVLTEEEHVVGRLRALGLSPADIGTVVVSHFDPDHAGANDEFPGAEFVVQRAQYEHARTSGLYRYEWFRGQWDDPRLRYRLVDGDTELLPGVTLLECGGHVPGHQAVLVRLPETGTVLLAGDAWARGTEAQTRPMSPFDLDEGETRKAQRRLMDLARRLPVDLVVHNHDAEQWASLRPSYR